MNGNPSDFLSSIRRRSGTRKTVPNDDNSKLNQYIELFLSKSEKFFGRVGFLPIFFSFPLGQAKVRKIYVRVINSGQSPFPDWKCCLLIFLLWQYLCRADRIPLPSRGAPLPKHIFVSQQGLRCSGHEVKHYQTAPFTTRCS